MILAAALILFMMRSKRLLSKGMTIRPMRSMAMRCLRQHGFSRANAKIAGSHSKNLRHAKCENTQSEGKGLEFGTRLHERFKCF